MRDITDDFVWQIIDVFEFFMLLGKKSKVSTLDLVIKCIFLHCEFGKTVPSPNCQDIGMLKMIKHHQKFPIASF